MILALLDNIRKYPQDRKSIWRAMEQLGRKHPGLISPLLPELLSLDPHFEMPEPNMADDCYVAVMIAVYNAASEESHLISLFPSHAERHYRFHRRRFTEFIPPVPLVSSLHCASIILLFSPQLVSYYDLAAVIYTHKHILYYDYIDVNVFKQGVNSLVKVHVYTIP